MKAKVKQCSLLFMLAPILNYCEFPVLWSIYCYIHVEKIVSSCTSADAPPSLVVLRHFPVKNGLIDIPEQIGTDYEKFGTFLLEDESGNKVKNIKVSERDDPLVITVEILRQWLQGKGKKPVTWQTLVTCLQDTGLHVLAGKIDDSLSEHNESKENLDHQHPEL